MTLGYRRDMRGLWPISILISVSLICVTILAALHVDISGLMSAITLVVVPTIGAALWARVDAVAKQTNGHTTQLVSLVRAQSDQLAKSQPPSEESTP